ncbi:hypothetical protein [Blastococcus haudaquaticus]|uniref:Lipoprotein n=1 Tax=Blastococcus haudaquaticus TaxID=1938745 RepID=A0A286GIY5_9ACTN|nr:hypothetical protein [Blastococcus haudaquaticus]SOD95493.1 hypothetical protein SAMN06272739_1229 [Blastococcus haudaquaticus]
MPPRVVRLVVAAALGLALMTGCTADDAAGRPIGGGVTEAEAQQLAALLQRNQQRGGADFVATAPYGEGRLLTLTGSVDFREGVGRAQAVTSFDDGRPEDTRTLFFTPEDVWVGDVPGMAKALAAAGGPAAGYLRRPVTTGTEDGVPLLVDVLTEVLLNLTARAADDPRSFLDGGYTWQGQRSIDSRLTTLFGLPGGRTVAVSSSDDLLTQFVTTVAQGGFDVTITLSDHGMRRIDLPADDQTAEAAAYPEVAAALGI